MGFNTIDSGLNSPMPAVASLVTNSPDNALHRAGGNLVSKSLQCRLGVGAHLYDCFSVVDAVEILGLWAVVTAKTDSTKWDKLSFRWNDAATDNDLTLHNGVTTANGCAKGSIMVKTGDVTKAATFLSATTGGVVEGTTVTPPFQDFILIPKVGVANKIQFEDEEDAATDLWITVYCVWIRRSPDGLVAAL